MEGHHGHQFETTHLEFGENTTDRAAQRSKSEWGKCSLVSLDDKVLYFTTYFGTRRTPCIAHTSN